MVDIWIQQVYYRYMVKEVTTEDLAGMIQRGFADTARKEDMDKRFDAVDRRFDRIESDVSYLKSRVEELGRTLDNHGEILEEHSKELEFLHKKIDELTDPRNATHAITFKEFAELELRVTSLEKKVAAQI